MFDFQSLIKYLLEGLAVAVAAYLIPQKVVAPTEIALIALTAAAVFAVLDQFAPLVAVGARQGAGFGIGLNQVGWGYEGFEADPLNPGYDVNGNPMPQEGYEDYEQFQEQTESAEPTEEAQVGGYEDEEAQVGGYDDHEGFADTPSPSPNICKMKNNTCEYDEDVNSDKKKNYICSNDNGSCKALESSDVCKMTDDKCEWSERGRKLSEKERANRKCHKDNGSCKLKSDMSTNEGFESQISGFEGFSRVY